jgi:hypothetical protein
MRRRTKLAPISGLTAGVLSQACRTFLSQAYADAVVPVAKRRFLETTPPPSLTDLLAPPLCQPLKGPDGRFRGYALRLGCGWFPHLKLQVIACAEGACVFGVDTHDVMELAPDHPDADGLARLQAANRCLKERIERAWETDGLRTFNSLLRDGLLPPEHQPDCR